MKENLNTWDALIGCFPKPVEKTKYMDWDKVKEIVNQNPNSVIRAGLREDWAWTSGLIFARGKYYDGYVFGRSDWATPIVDVNGVEIECYTYDEPENFTTGLPSWWGDRVPLPSEYDFQAEEEHYKKLEETITEWDKK